MSEKKWREFWINANPDNRGWSEGKPDQELIDMNPYGAVHVIEKAAYDECNSDLRHHVKIMVFFSVIIDDVTGKEEFKLHLLPDRKTPRVWFLSEIGAEYHKKGDSNPKLAGLHPNCRCKLTYLAPGWGFTKDGKVTYIGPDHDEISKQREEYGKPS